MKVAEYKILQGSFKSLTDQVNKDIKEGWQPYGSMTTTEEQLYAQAMVKPAKGNVAF